MQEEHEVLFFTKPGNPRHRLYEALRAIYVDGFTVPEAAKKFGYSPGGLHVQKSLFRNGKLGPFFVENKPGPKSRPRRDPVRDRVMELRKKNHSIYDISRVLKDQKHPLSARSVWEILREAGFSRLPRRLDEERPECAKPQEAPRADRRSLILAEPQVCDTQSAGLFLFLPDLILLGIEKHVMAARLPGTKAIPALQYVLSILALKLLGRERYSHVMDCCHDQGLGLFAGLNAIPKTTALTTYSYRVAPSQTQAFLRSLVRSARELGVIDGESINLDFHSIPHFGEESVLEKHYVPRRSHAEKSVLVCLAQDGTSRAFCYSNATIKKKETPEEVMRFCAFWKKTTGADPNELVFDSRFTTIEKLNQLNKRGIKFITLRTRSQKFVADLLALPKASWEHCTLDVPHRKYKTPRFYESRITLDGYDGSVRQLAVMDLGREAPTIIITNHLQTRVKVVLERYAKRMIIENAIADGIHFFHLDALCSSVNIEVDFSVALTVLAELLYRMFARRIAGFGEATAKQLFRKFVNSTGGIKIQDGEMVVAMARRAHNPLLLEAGYHRQSVTVPWLEDHVVRYRFT